MRVVFFVHSLVSDWNHGNAHFLRGVVRELLARGHSVEVLEPADGWSRANLVADHGTAPIAELTATMPELRSRTYRVEALDATAATAGADLVIVHEWNDPAVVAAVGGARATNGFRLLFHDTHHRIVTAPEEMARFDLTAYDGVLAFGEVIRELYLERGLADRAWTWHEAADVRTFHPLPHIERAGDLIWIGNWGDGERTNELLQLLIEPVERLAIRGLVHGVRYPPEALHRLARAGIRYGGWIANHRVPAAFAAHRVTVHVPRRPYVEALPGIPTIRPFEALACGIPLVSAPWDDFEGLFRAGTDYLVAGDTATMTRSLDEVLHDDSLATSLRESGLETIRARHTCAHRVDELLEIAGQLGLDAQPAHMEVVS